MVAVTVLTTGCGYFKKGRLAQAVEYHLEVSGASVDKISYSYVNEDEGKFQEEVPAPALPWKLAGVAFPGEIRIDLTPTGGPATCRIVVEKKQLAKKEGRPGAPLSCVGKVEAS
jgi:hypothetical protein